MKHAKLDFLEAHETPYLDTPPRIREESQISANDPMWKVSQELTSVNRKNGWFWTADEIPKAIALCHSELSEALEEDRNRTEGWEERFCEELGDVVIRCLDLATQLNMPIEDLIIAKIRKNSTRGFKHGNKRY